MHLRVQGEHVPYLYIGIVAAILPAVFVVWLFCDRLIQIVARIDSWYSPLRTRPLQGNIMYVLKGGPKGPLDRVLHSIKGWKINDVSGEFEEIPADAPKPERRYLEDELGVVWVGFNRRLYSRTRTYSSYELDGGVQTLVEKTREGPEFFFQTNLAVMLSRAEDKSNFPLNARIMATMRLTNPEKAEFMAGKPEVQAMSAMQSMGRLFVGQYFFEDIRRKSISIAPATAGTPPVQPVPKRKGKKTSKNGKNGKSTPPVPAADLENLKEKYGIEMVSIRIEEIDPADPDSDYAKATRQKGLNEINAKAAVIKAKEIITLGEAEAKRARLVFGAKRGQGDIALAEAIQNAVENAPEGLSTLVIGSVAGTSVPIQATPRRAPPASPAPVARPTRRNRPKPPKAATPTVPASPAPAVPPNTAGP